MMPLTPMDIHNKEFTKAFRGYDEDEVNEFLDRIVKDYEALIKENEAMKQKIQELSDKLEHYAKIEETLHNAIIVAQQTAKEVKEAALGEADLIRREAERESRREIERAWPGPAKSNGKLKSWSSRPTSFGAGSAACWKRNWR